MMPHLDSRKTGNSRGRYRERKSSPQSMWRLGKKKKKSIKRILEKLKKIKRGENSMAKETIG